MGRFTKYLCHPQFLPLTIVKICAFICTILSTTFTIRYGNISGSKKYVIVSIYVLNLFIFFFLFITLWFIAQKFYWLIVEQCLDFLMVLFAAMSSYLNIKIILIVISDKSAHINLLVIGLIFQLMTMICCIFSFFWATFTTGNIVSKLLIRNWGKESGQDDVEIELFNL